MTFDGENVWVANWVDNTVMKIRACDGLLLGTFPVGSAPDDLTFDGTNIWVINEIATTVTKLRASDGAFEGTFPVPNNGTDLHGIFFDGANIILGDSKDTVSSS